jgi:redox-sensitive bicupin YhaK (pirin superfamily)
MSRIPMSNEQQPRALARLLPGIETSDGAGVKLRRSIGARQSLRLDPFLMLDEFGTENPDDYIAGFPPHPHRGFETVTYMIDGHMRHEDHLGNIGELKSGGVQWMTAGRGVIHSEMPQQESGRMRGFQLWINLPARDKMQPAAYRDIAADEIPTTELGETGRLKLIAGRLELDGDVLAGPINTLPNSMATDPLFVDLQLAADQEYRLAVPRGHSAFVYAYEGTATIGETPLPTQQAGILDDGDYVDVIAGDGGLRMIVVAGKALAEPIAQYGPFVMNTQAEIEQALEDYREGRLTD